MPFFFKRVQIFEYLFVIMDDTVSFAFLMIQSHEFCAVWTVYCVLIPISLHILLFQGRKQQIKLMVKVFLVSLTKCQSHAKRKNTIYFCFYAVIQNSRDILFCIIDKRQNRAKSYNRGYSCIPHLFQYFEAFPRSAYVWLDFSA